MRPESSFIREMASSLGLFTRDRTTMKAFQEQYIRPTNPSRSMDVPTYPRLAEAQYKTRVAVLRSPAHL